MRSLSALCPQGTGKGFTRRRAHSQRPMRCAFGSHHKLNILSSSSSPRPRCVFSRAPPQDQWEHSSMSVLARLQGHPVLPQVGRPVTGQTEPEWRQTSFRSRPTQDSNSTSLKFFQDSPAPLQDCATTHCHSTHPVCPCLCAIATLGILYLGCAAWSPYLTSVLPLPFPFRFAVHLPFPGQFCSGHRWFFRTCFGSVQRWRWRIAAC